MIAAEVKNRNTLYTQIMREELLPAMGCTEPIAISYAGALVCQALGSLPKSLTVELSGSIVKNVKSVVVPHTGSRRGIGIALAAGIVAGDADAKLEVLAKITDQELPAIIDFYESCPLTLIVSDRPEEFYIGVTAVAATHRAFVEICNQHTNVTRIELDGELVFAGGAGSFEEEATDRSILSVEGILDYANSVPLEVLSPLLEPMITYNCKISCEGLDHKWGAQIGRMLLSRNNNDMLNRLKAAAAAGSDARMSGCELPVVIVSGSGNQGLAASMPVIEYAHIRGMKKERLLRALAVSVLITIHQKTGIGRLSAFCGAVSAGCGAACGVAYLDGCSLNQIDSVIENTLAITSGMVCDGAKPSCAAKIAAAVDAGLTGYAMVRYGTSFHPGDGILGDNVENTIANIGRLARVGMQYTNREILHIMTE